MTPAPPASVALRPLLLHRFALNAIHFYGCRLQIKVMDLNPIDTSHFTAFSAALFSSNLIKTHSLRLYRRDVDVLNTLT